MSSERFWVTVRRGISPDISEPVLTREVDSELAAAEPMLVLGLKQAMGSLLEDRGLLGRWPVDGRESAEGE